jgi:hypothetical protein
MFEPHEPINISAVMPAMLLTGSCITGKHHQMLHLSSPARYNLRTTQAAGAHLWPETT